MEYFFWSLIPHPRLKAELEQQFVSIHAKERGISTSIGGYDSCFIQYSYIFSITINKISYNVHNFNNLKNTFKKE
jgi:hypothetical protein